MVGIKKWREGGDGGTDKEEMDVYVGSDVVDLVITYTVKLRYLKLFWTV